MTCPSRGIWVSAFPFRKSESSPRLLPCQSVWWIPWWLRRWRTLLQCRETWVQSLSQEDPLEKGMTTHSSILACRIPWTEQPGGLQSVGSQRIGLDWETNTFTLLFFHFMLRAAEAGTKQMSLTLRLSSFLSKGMLKQGKTCLERWKSSRYISYIYRWERIIWP